MGDLGTAGGPNAHHSLSPLGMKEKREKQERMRRTGNDKFQRMQTVMKGKAKAELLKRGSEWAQLKGRRGPDRLCQRSRDALICWFCEHCGELIEQTVPVPVPDPAVLDGFEWEEEVFVDPSDYDYDERGYDSQLEQPS
jgi:hypothetical protein